MALLISPRRGPPGVQSLDQSFNPGPTPLTLNAGHPLAQGLTHFWWFPGGGKILPDRFGTLGQGSLEGAATWAGNAFAASGVAQPSVQFDGSDSDVSLGTNNTVNTLHSLVVGWVHAASQPGHIATALLAKGLWGGDANGDARLVLNASDEILYEITDGTTTRICGNEGTVLGQWYTTVGTYDGATMRLYVNGALRRTLGVATSIVNNSHAAMLGAYPGNTSGTTLNGRIGYAAIYNRPLSTAEIWMLQTQPYGTFVAPGPRWWAVPNGAFVADITRTVPESAALGTTTTQTVPQSALLASGLGRAVPQQMAIATDTLRTVPQAALFPPVPRSVGQSAALGLSPADTRAVPQTMAIAIDTRRTVPQQMVLSPFARSVPQAMQLSPVGTQPPRTVPQGAVLRLRGTSRSVDQAAALGTNQRDLAQAMVVAATAQRRLAQRMTLSAAGSARTVGQSAALGVLALTRGVGQAGLLRATDTRTVGQAALLERHSIVVRTVPAHAALRRTQARSVGQRMALGGASRHIRGTVKVKVGTPEVKISVSAEPGITVEV